MNHLVYKTSENNEKYPSQYVMTSSKCQIPKIFSFIIMQNQDKLQVFTFENLERSNFWEYLVEK